MYKGLEWNGSVIADVNESVFIFMRLTGVIALCRLQHL